MEGTELRSAELDVAELHDLGLYEYMNYSQYEDFLGNISTEFSSIVSLETIGLSWEGRPIHVVVVNGNPGVYNGEPRVLAIGNMHGDEVLSGDALIWFLHRIVSSYGSDQEVTDMVDSRELWFVPILNPDGREKTLSGTPWRKNMRNNGDGNYGVDLNRNFEYQWGAGISSNNTGSENYRGPAPFSEPETRAIRDNLTANRSFELVLSYHNHGQLVLYPWGYGPTVPPDQAPLSNLSRAMASLSGPEWRYGQASDSSIGMYSAGGDACDWFYAQGTFALTLEMGEEKMPPNPFSEAEAHRSAFFHAIWASSNPFGARWFDWTVLVYMAADNNLHNYAIHDLKEMESVDVPDTVATVVLFDGNQNNDTWVYEMEYADDQNAEVSSPRFRPDFIPAHGEADMSNPETLKNFLSWGLENYPSRNTLFIFWDHGKGIFGGVCQDKTGYLKLWEIGPAFEEVLGWRKLDIVGFDVCWLGNVETVVEIASHA
ncbi:MAG: M14 family zinc carboxypeptidase, partial [Candidatus Thermoplasmatota archaeon]|nr:M14 family zinc carboxypeptidase [Candidatus Thermoplasmatota archaeon]